MIRTRLMTALGSILFIALVSIFGPVAYGQIWTVLAFDPKGDAKDASLADAAQLSYKYAKEKDFLWFRIPLYGSVNEQAFGVNIVIDTDAGDEAKLSWWGANTAFKFNKLITAWVTRANGTYQGTIGVGD